MNDVVAGYDIRLLSPFEARLYGSMSPVADLAYFPDMGQEDRGILIGAQAEGQPVGLAAAEVFPDGRGATIVSLFVEPAHRRQGIGTALLEQILQKLSAFGCEEAEISYMPAAGSTETDRFLSMRGWGPPRFTGLFLHYSERIGDAPWLGNQSRPGGATIVHFDELDERDEIELARIVEEDQVPEYLDPRALREIMHAGTSYAARSGGRLIGWCVTQPASRDTLRYASVYVRTALRGTGTVIALLRASIVSHIALRATFPFGLQAIPPSATDMLRFAERRMEPWADRVERMYVRSRILRDTEN